MKATASVLKAKASQLRLTKVPLKDGPELEVAATGAVRAECDRTDQVESNEQLGKEWPICATLPCANI